MGRRREPALSAAEGYELCPMCGQPVTVGPDGRCELGHRVRTPVTDVWVDDDPAFTEAATTMPIAVGLDEPLPEGELREALAGPLDLDADDAATVELAPQEPDDGEPEAAAGDEEDGSEDEPEEQPRPASDLGGELDW